MRKILASLLAIMLIVSCIPALADYNDHTDYTTGWPFVTDGSVKVTVLGQKDETYGKEADEQWFWIWSEQATGIDFEVEKLLSSAVAEAKTLRFATGDLPDLMFNIPLSTSELVRYGMDEELLLDLTPYITPEIMPNLCGINEVFPDGLKYCTTPDGKIYSFPGYVDLYILSCPGGDITVNTYYLAEAGYTYGNMPETLDEFIDYLYTIKERHPEMYPLGGSDQNSSAFSALLNAFGFVWAKNSQMSSNIYGYYPAVKYTGDETELVMPVMDERYEEYVGLLHQLFVDGILDPEYYTKDLTAVTAGFETNAYAAVGGSGWEQSNIDASIFHDWTFAKPFTSKYQNTPRQGMPQKYYTGTVYMSADIEPEKAEAICRWLDFFYSDVGGMYLWCGPAATSADCIGLIGGFTADEKGSAQYLDKDGNVITSTERMRGDCGGWTTFGNRSNPWKDQEAFQNGVTNRPEMRNWFYDKSLVPYGYDPNWGNGWAMRSLKDAVEPYRVESYPVTVFFDADTTLRLDDLHLELDKYIEGELAKFIVGQRDMGEFKTFQEELKKLNIEEMFEIYKGAYDAFLAAAN